MKAKFTDKQLRVAKSVDLTLIAGSMGYTVEQIGQNHTLKEMGSIRIYNRTNWYRWSARIGGSQIDFLIKICGMEFREAVLWLLDFAGYETGKQKDGKPELKHQVNISPVTKVPFTLPIKAADNRLLYKYLHEQRRLGIAIIDYFLNCKLIYQSSPHNNIVFVGIDASGVQPFAHMSGTNSAFKCDVAGSDKNYGFNIPNSKSDHLNVFESGH